MSEKHVLSQKETKAMLNILGTRFDKHRSRHKGIRWRSVLHKLESDPEKLWSLNQMELTGGEPDVIGYDLASDEYIYVDCVKESPIGRRSLCYDLEGLNSRKDNKPKGNAMDMAAEMGVEILTPQQYKNLQKIETFDMKSSSWLKTPEEIRKEGGALFGDFRFGSIFVYHNTAGSYYSARGFRAMLRV